MSVKEFFMIRLCRELFQRCHWHCNLIQRMTVGGHHCSTREPVFCCRLHPCPQENQRIECHAREEK